MDPRPVYLVARAADFAARAHARQQRKDGETPYINHLTEVAHLLAHAGCEDYVVAAAYLHDTIEDVGVTYETLVAQFGVAIADLVAAVTDDKQLPKAQRKQLQVEHAPHATPEKSALKLADKISNLRSLRDAPPKDWPSERIAGYVDWAHRVVSGLPERNPLLMEQYEAVRAELLSRQK